MTAPQHRTDKDWKVLGHIKREDLGSCIDVRELHHLSPKALLEYCKKLRVANSEFRQQNSRLRGRNNELEERFKEQKDFTRRAFSGYLDGSGEFNKAMTKQRRESKRLEAIKSNIKTVKEIASEQEAERAEAE